MEWYRNEKAAVVEASRRGERPDLATTMASGPLDELVALHQELGIFAILLDEVEVQRERAGVPDQLLLRMLATLPFVEQASLSGASSVLFREPAVLLQLGRAPVQIRHGSRIASWKNLTLPEIVASWETLLCSDPPNCILCVLIGYDLDDAAYFYPFYLTDGLCAKSKAPCAESAIMSAITSEEVAAGEGALRTCNAPPSRLTMKSSTRVPSGASACARTPDGPASKSLRRRSGR